MNAIARSAPWMLGVALRPYHRALGILMLAAILFVFGSDGPARAQSVDLSVAWTSDWTTNPETTVISRSGPVAGDTTVNVMFSGPAGTISPTVKKLTIREQAGHITDADHPGTGENLNATMTSTQNAWEWSYSAPWLTSYLDHNSAYDITVSIHYTVVVSYYPFVEYEADSPDTTITVTPGNLTVHATQPENPTPILWDPAAGPVTLKATANAIYRKLQPIKLNIYPVDQTPIKSLQQSVVIGPGDTPLQFTWDGSTDPPAPPGPAKKGIYFFKWDVGESAGPPDMDSDKSTFLNLGPASPSPGYVFKIDSIDLASAYIHSHSEFAVTDSWSQPPSNLATYLYDPYFVAFAVKTVDPASIVLGNQMVVFDPANMDKAGDNTFLIQSLDRDDGHDKGHRVRWALQYGQIHEVLTAACFGFTLAGSSARGNAPIDTTSSPEKAWYHLRRLSPPDQYGEAYFDDGGANVWGGVLIDATKAVAMHALRAAVFNVDTHANAGAIAFLDADIGVADISTLPTGALDRLRFAHLQGCDTAKNDMQTSICDAFRSQGADCVLGYFDEITNGYGGIFNDSLYGALASGSAVSAAVIIAKADLKNAIGDEAYTLSGYDSATILGTATISPPMWGIIGQ